MSEQAFRAYRRDTGLGWLDGVVFLATTIAIMTAGCLVLLSVLDATLG